MFEIYLIGIIPSMVMMYVLFAEFEGAFEENKMLQFLALGMVLGTFSAIIHRFTIAEIGTDYTFSLLIFVVGYSMVEELSKIVVINFPKLADIGHNLVFYGAVLGFGMSTTITISFSFNIVARTGQIQIITMIMFAIFQALLQGATGAIIGYGVFTNQRKSYYQRAIMFHMMAYIPLMSFLWPSEIRIFNMLSINILAMIPAVAIAGYIFIYVYKIIIPQALPDNMKSKRRMMLRRQN